MNFNNIRNVGYPQQNADAVPKSFVDNKTDSLKESIDKKILDTMTTLAKMLTGGLKKRTHIITASASYHGDLIKNDYQFTWGGQSVTSYKKHDVFNGFLVPSSGYINPFPNKPWFLLVCSASLLKTLWEKEKLLVTSNFSFSHSVFYPFGELSTIFIKFEIVICKLFQFGRV